MKKIHINPKGTVWLIPKCLLLNYLFIAFLVPFNTSPFVNNAAYYVDVSSEKHILSVIIILNFKEQKRLR